MKNEKFMVLDFSYNMYLLCRHEAHLEGAVFSGGHEECVEFLELVGAKKLANAEDGGGVWWKRVEV